MARYHLEIETCGLRKVGQGNFDSGVISENSVDLRYSERLQLGTIQQVSIGPRGFGLHNNLQTDLSSEILNQIMSRCVALKLSKNSFLI